jgi:hypothetical protein
VAAATWGADTRRTRASVARSAQGRSAPALSVWLPRGALPASLVHFAGPCDHRKPLLGSCGGTLGGSSASASWGAPGMAAAGDWGRSEALACDAAEEYMNAFPGTDTNVPV